MKRFYLASLPLVVAILAVVGFSAKGQTITSFSYTAGMQQLSIPAGVFEVTFDATGAAGGTDASYGCAGGKGGRLQGAFAVTPGQLLYIYVGGVGANNNTSGSSAGGYNGGGSGGTYYGGGGGGGTDIRFSTNNTLAGRVLSVGGGGGGGLDCGGGEDYGGAGGGPSGGASGAICDETGECEDGSGGTSTGGGAGGCEGSGSGGQGVGGSGSEYGGGGGGGWYGGSGGGFAGGGGGATGYTSSVISVSNVQGYTSATGNGYCNIDLICTPPTGGAIVGPSGLCLPAVGSLVTPYIYSGSTGGGWYSQNPSITTISNTGVVTAVATGAVTISYSLVYSCGSATGTAVVNVNPTPSAVFPASGSTCQGTTITFGDGDNDGTWSSSNSALATVGTSGPANCIVTGSAVGNATVTYTEIDGCTAIATLTVNPGPYVINGTPTLCGGTSTTLSEVSTGGYWNSVSTAVATVGSTTGTVTAGTVVTVPTEVGIKYTLTSTGCSATFPLTVDPLPNSTYTITHTGGLSYCSGGSGVNLGLSNSALNTNYQLIFNGTTNIGSPVTGTNGAIPFGVQTLAGTYSVQAMTIATGCISTMASTAAISVNPLPSQFSLTATDGGAFCSSSCGVDIMLSGTEEGYGYSLYQTGVGLIGSTYFNFSDPTDAGIDFGAYDGGSFGNPSCGLSGPGSYFAVAYNISTGCQDTMINQPNVVMNNVPNVHNVTVDNGGVFCAGSLGVHIHLDYSDAGVNYQLWQGATLVTTLPGINATLDFGYQNVDGGSYTVNAINPTTGCSSAMSGNPVLSATMPPGAYPVSGGGSRCYGGAAVDINLPVNDINVSYQLYRNDTMVGLAQVGTGIGGLDLGSWYSAGRYTVVGTDLGTGCVNGMTGYQNISVQSLPTAELVTGGGSFCQGATTGLPVTLSSTQNGVSYILQVDGSPISEMTGTGSTISFNGLTGAGYYTVMAIDSLTTLYCSSVMTGGQSINIDPLPEFDTVIGGGAYCSGGSGLHVALNYSSLGIQYQLYNGSSMVGAAVNGSNATIDFGVIAVPGSYWVSAKNIMTGCRDTMTGSSVVSINPLPYSYSVTNGGSYCAGGTGVAVGLSGSATGISYQLEIGGAITGSPVSGTGAPINFGMQTLAGNYTVVATNTTTGCVGGMTGERTVAINAVPNAYNVTGGGTICAGATGVNVGLSNSTNAISYQLWSGTTLLSTMTGTGGSLNFGTYTTEGNYTVYASNPTTLCAANMSGAASITVNAVPAAYTVTGGGDYCAGSGGLHVGLSNSTTGISYQLMLGTTSYGLPVTGVSGSPLDFGLLSMAGNYSVYATNSITGCSAPMTGSQSVAVNPLPTAYTVSGGGSICSGAPGLNIGLSGSATGFTYSLVNGTTTSGTMSGTGGALNFSGISNSGTYNITAKNNTTGCSVNMTSDAVVVVNAVPATYNVTGGGSYCDGGTGVHIGLIGSGYGINYQLMRGTTHVSLPVGGTGSSLDMGLQTVAGTYTIMATDDITGCFSTMTGDASIGITPSVVPGVTISSNQGANVCEGAPVSYSASATNGGTSPSFVWKVGGVDVGTGSTFEYVPSNLDVVSCYLTSNATCVTPATTNTSMTMNVINWVLPAADVTVNPGSSVCPGTAVTFSATTANGGTSPVYHWLTNSAYQAASGMSLTYTPSNNDVVVFMLVSNEKCASVDTVFSNPVVINIESTVAPVFTLQSHLGQNIGVGQSDTIRALVSNEGTTPLDYTWYINGNQVYNNNGYRLVIDTAFNGDSVTCVVTTQGDCGGTSTAEGTRIMLENLAVKNVAAGSDLKVIPNPNKGEFAITGSLSSLNTQTATIEVTNMLGQVVYSGSVDVKDGAVNSRVSLGANITNGMYLLTLRSGDQNLVYHFVVEQ